ncbi:Pirin domain protein [Calothrix sp. PCC 6303]|nr:Pirin domain protein [Calothrix sp. PCC 6303]
MHVNNLNTMTSSLISHLVHHSDARGITQLDWLDSRHTFSFGNFYDSERMGFRSLRVINDDHIAPGRGFATHPHKDMEILTYVLDGALEHKDSLGNGSVILPGEAQVMSAGTGIRHSEYNASTTDPVHLLQIWILPSRNNLEPRYEQKAFSVAERSGKLRLIAAQDGRDGAVTIYQDLNLYTAILSPGEQVSYNLLPNRHGWLQVAKGVVTFNQETLHGGDAVQLSGENELEISSDVGGEILLFDLG